MLRCLQATCCWAKDAALRLHRCGATGAKACQRGRQPASQPPLATVHAVIWLCQHAMVASAKQSCARVKPPGQCTQSRTASCTRTSCVLEQHTVHLGCTSILGCAVVHCACCPLRARTHSLLDASLTAERYGVSYPLCNAQPSMSTDTIASTLTPLLPARTHFLHCPAGSAGSRAAAPLHAAHWCG
jgi:hypothetical protein